MFIHFVGTNTFYIYFDTEEGLKEFLEENNIGEYCGTGMRLDYLDEFADRRRVIRKVYLDGQCSYYTYSDEFGHRQYNLQRSKKEKRNIWDYEYITIEYLYYPFIAFGIEIPEYIRDGYSFRLEQIGKKAYFNLRNGHKVKKKEYRSINMELY